MQEDYAFFGTSNPEINFLSESEGIGTYNEKTLHRVIKHIIEPDENNHEVALGSFIVDIYNSSGVFEIQTRDFSKLRDKLRFLLKEHTVTVVFPIATTKHIMWVDKQTGEITKKRLSPKRGKPWDAFFELYWIREFLAHKNLKIKILLTAMEEYRNLDGWSRDKKKGSSRLERIPVGDIYEINIENAGDYKYLIPPGLPNPFTVADFASCAKITKRVAYPASNVLLSLKVINRIGKAGRSYLYELNPKVLDL